MKNINYARACKTFCLRIRRYYLHKCTYHLLSIHLLANFQNLAMTSLTLPYTVYTIEILLSYNTNIKLAQWQPTPINLYIQYSVETPIRTILTRIHLIIIIMTMLIFMVVIMVVIIILAATAIGWFHGRSCRWRNGCCNGVLTAVRGARTGATAHV